MTIRKVIMIRDAAAKRAADARQNEAEREKSARLVEAFDTLIAKTLRRQA